MAKVTLVNHASIIIEEAGVSLLSDPWLEGSTFHNGWDLIAPTVFSFADFQKITHIWFSHEHPDHFYPPNLKRIPEDARRAITVLFQETSDKKLIRFCQGLGFQTQELSHAVWVQLAPGFRVLCGKVPFYDSWLLIEAGKKRILNFNDCVLKTESAVMSIRNRIGTPVDVLLTQFSYAAWVGNPEDKLEREKAACQVLERLSVQNRVIRPKYLIPFASFIYFGHKENFYLNDSMNTVANAASRITLDGVSTAVILYPGDEWSVGQEHDNGSALARWAAAYAAVPRLSMRESKSVTLEKILQLSAQYQRRIWTKNNRLFLRLLSLVGFFPRVLIRLKDVEKCVTFDVKNGIKLLEKDPPELVDIEIVSEVLAFLLEFEWGIDTLIVNGRFRATNKDFLRVTRAFSVGALNNTGRNLGFGMMADWRFCQKVLVRLLVSFNSARVEPAT